MGKYVIIAILAGLAIYGQAQKKKAIESGKKNETEMLKSDSAIQKRLQEFNTFREKHKFTFTQPGESEKNDSVLQQSISGQPNYRMPVVKPGSYQFNMPVAVPDSTVDYYLQIKKIDGVNPKEKKR